MSRLSDKAPLNDRVLHVYYDFETTQNTSYNGTSFEYLPNLVCLQQY
jgi:hypothetical protein